MTRHHCCPLSRWLGRCLMLGVLSVGVSAAVGAETQPGAATGAINVSSSDWPWWRGSQRNGTAVADQTPPLKWSESENVVWKSPLAGKSHGSPIVVGDQVFVAVADDVAEQQVLVCLDRATGDLRWRSVAHEGGWMEGGHEKSSHASSTPACDGAQVYINFLNDGAAYTTAFDLQGKRVWQSKIADYVLHQGYGSSPTLYNDLVIASADNKGGGAIVAFERSSGVLVWKRSRPSEPNYTTPIVLTAGGRDQIVLAGCNLVTSLDPQTGNELWEIEGATSECVTSAVTDGSRVFVSGGFPKNFTAGIAADGSGEVEWEVNVRTYVPSMVVHDGHLYAVLDGGIATCRRADTGEEMWRERLSGTFTSSLVLVGDTIYACNEEGKTFVYKARPDAFESLAVNTLGEGVMASPAIANGQLFLRVAHEEDGQRQEYLYCIGQ